MYTPGFILLQDASISRKLKAVMADVARLSQLQAPTAADIHQLRVNIKRLRAWLRLLQKRKIFRNPDKLDRRLSALAAHYSDARDALVRRQTLQWLLAQQADVQATLLVSEDAAPLDVVSADVVSAEVVSVEAASVDVAQADVAQVNAGLGNISPDVAPVDLEPLDVDLAELTTENVAMDALAGCAVLLQNLQDEVAGPPDPTLIAGAERALQQLAVSCSRFESADLLKGLQATYRKARQLLRKAAASTAAEDLHRLRKWVKYLMYQVELVSRYKAGSARTLHKQLKELAASLGTYHDLVVLDARVQALRNQTPATGLDGELTLATTLVSSASTGLQETSLQLAAECFREKAGPRFSP